MTWFLTLEGEFDMKKLILALIIGLVFMLAACNASDNDNQGNDTQAAAGNAHDTQGQEPATNETTQPNEDDPSPAYSNSPDLEGFAFAIQGVTIYMDQDIDIVLEQLGEPLGVFEAPSCAFDGIDRIFSFPGVQIHTYPEGELDFVHTISIRDDSVTTMGGIYLGSSWEDVLAAYGNDYEQEFGMVTFTRGQTTLSFFIEDDMVTGITYELIMG